MRDKPHVDRTSDLERIVNAGGISAHANPGTIGRTRQSRLAVTVPAPTDDSASDASFSDSEGDNYPRRSDNPNTYWIVFVDAKYDKHQGNSAAHIKYRQFYDQPRVLARNTIENSYVEKNTLLEVTYYEGQWWFTRGEGEGQQEESSASEDSWSDSSSSEESSSEESSDGGGDSSSGSGGESGSGSGGSQSGSGGESSVGSGGDSGSGGSGGSGGGDSGTSKDTAIVPSRFSPTGYTALACVEAPEVLFVEVVQKEVREDTTFQIDPKFLDVCEPGTMKAIASADVPAAVGAKVIGGDVSIRLSSYAEPATVTVLLIATRKLFKQWRMPDKTREQFEANERRLQS